MTTQAEIKAGHKLPLSKGGSLPDEPATEPTEPSEPTAPEPEPEPEP